MTRNTHTPLNHHGPADAGRPHQQAIYRRLIDLSPDLIGVYVDSRWVLINPAGARMLGASSPGEVIGQPSLLGIHPTDLPLVEERAARVTNHGAPLPEITVRILRPDGSVVYAAGSAEPTTYEGQPATLVYARDVTARVLAENQLRESEATLRALIDQNPESLFLMDPDGTILASNETSARRLRQDPATLAGANVYDLLPPDAARVRRAAVEEVLRTAGSVSVEDTRYDRHFDNRIWPILDADGNVVRLAVLGIDVTDRTHAEEALRASEERFKHLFEFAPDAFYILDLQGRMLDGNRAAEQLVGCRREELIGRDLVESGILSPDDAPRIAAGVTRAAHGEAIGPEEYLIHRRDGTHAAVEIRAFPTRIAGEPVVLGIARDNTERKRAEEARRESEARLREAHQLARIGTWRWDARTDAVLWSDVLYDITGRDPRLPAPSPRQQASLYSPESWARLQAAAARAAQHGEPYEIPIQVLRPDGEDRWIRARGGPLYDAQGALVALYGTAQDITEHWRAEQALAQSEAKYHSLFDLSADAIILAHPRDGFILEANAAAAALFGCAPADLQGCAFYALIAPALREEAMREGKRQLAERDRFLVLTEVLRADGTSVPVTAAGTRLHLQGQELLHLILRDDTECRLLEGELRQSQKMEAVGRLAAGVAHDFNNALTPIITYCELLLTRLPPDDRNHHYARQILRAADMGANLPRQLLAFSRKQVLRPRPLDLNALLTDLAGMLARMIGEDIRLTLSPASDLAPIMADPGQMEQILMNLAVNARDAMPSGGTLTIETADLSLDDAYARLHPGVAPGDYVLVAVSDTGCGMNRDTQARIFEPFFTTKPEGKGTGLGLSTVYGIVTQSGGHITVYSEVGIGTTFRVYLPRLAAKDAPLEQPRPVLVGGTETILVVEDNDAVRLAAQDALEWRGYTVLLADGGPDALLVSATHDGPIHLLLTDVVMPTVSGPQLASALHTLRPHMRILYMSGYTPEAISQHGILDTAADLLQKPFTPTTLLEKVRDVLDRPPGS